MWDFNEVVSFEYRGCRVLYLCFDDGLEGEIDFAGYIQKGPIFKPLEDEAFFRKARIEGGTIAWPNGADVAPETLYAILSERKKIKV